MCWWMYGSDDADPPYPLQSTLTLIFATSNTSCSVLYGAYGCETRCTQKQDNELAVLF
jgi:hypothetical protein